MRRRLCLPEDFGRGSFLHIQQLSIHKRFVYVLRSIPELTRSYIGLTSNVATRLAVHNSGGSSHPASLRLWDPRAALDRQDRNPRGESDTFDAVHFFSSRSTLRRLDQAAGAADATREAALDRPGSVGVTGGVL